MNESFEIVPLGSFISVELINGIEPKRLSRLMSKIVEALPIDENLRVFSSEEREGLCSSLNIQISQLTTLISTSIHMWRAIAYHQPKPVALEQLMQEAGFTPSTVTTLLSVWSAQHKAVLDRLGRVSCSGLPRVLDVEWTVLGRQQGACCSPSVLLRLSTSAGPRHIRLTHAEAKKLFHATAHIQQAIDSLLQ